MTSITLPSDAMNKIVEFLDAKSFAKMAQVNKTWQRIAYQTEYWMHASWKIKKSGALLVTQTVPKDARHIGEKHEMCFIKWLAKQVKTPTNLPKSLVHTTDFEKLIVAAKVVWKELGKPCSIVNHHYVRDVLRFPLPSDLPMHERKRISLRIVEEPRKSDLKNAYAVWIDGQIEEMMYDLLVGYDLITRFPAGMYESDPLMKLIRDFAKLDADRDTYIKEHQRKICTMYQASSLRLKKYSSKEFDANEKWFREKNEEVWVAAGFSWTASAAAGGCGAAASTST